LDAGCGWIDVDVLNDVTHVDQATTDVDHFCQRKCIAEVAAVNVSTNDYRGSDFVQFFEDSGAVDIADVQDQRRIDEMCKGFGTE